MPVQQQPMTPMPFYADPNRFSTPVWQTDPSQVSGWQGQFIQQIPSAGQPIDTYQQYPNGIYQATYQQPAFEANTFYAGAVQVLTPTNARPPSVPNQQAQMIPPRPNSNYAHTPSPSPAAQQSQQQTQQQSQQQGGNNRQYQEYNQFASNVSEGNQSRPSSVNSVINQNPPTPNQNFNQGQQSQSQPQQQQTVYTTVSAANFSPSSNQQQSQFVNANSGNGQPGYPQVNASSPQVVSHNSSGYSGNEQYSGQHNQQWQQEHQTIMWEQQHQHHHHQHQMQENKMEQNYQQSDQHNAQERYMSQQQQENEGSPSKMQSDNVQKTFSQADKVNLNTRIKTMILNKQQNDAKMEQDVKSVEQSNTTGHFLWYSHHHHLDPLSVDGGPSKNASPNCDYLNVNNLSNNTQKFAQNHLKSTSTVRLGYNDFHVKPLKKQKRSVVKMEQENTQYFSTKDTFPAAPENNNRFHINSGNMYQNMGHNFLEVKSEPDYPRESIIAKAETLLDPELKFKQEYSEIDQSAITEMQELNIPKYEHSGKLDQLSNTITKQNHSRDSNSLHYLNVNPESQNKIHDRDEFQTSKDQHFNPEHNYAASNCLPQVNNSIDNSFLSQKYNFPANRDDYGRFQSPSFTPLSNTSPNVKINENLNQQHPYYSSSPTNNSNEPMSIKNKTKLLEGSSKINSQKESFNRNQIFASPERPKAWLQEKKKESVPQRSPKDKLYSPDSSDYIKSKFTEKVAPKIGEEIPQCHCFPPDQSPPEPGTYYTHLGCANNLRTLRHNLECQTGLSGPAIRIEKVRYTGKEGKTAQGCPIVKWVHRRVSIEEKYLVIVKHRTGHFCHSAFIVICLVVWEGVSKGYSDELYSLLTEKLNKFGLPTKRRCATNDPRTCACQGISEDSCGASFSFGCSWSMYYNGCKFTRSKEVRKFRLSMKEEEAQIEEKLQNLADHVSPIYQALAPDSFNNQTRFENVASDCRLGSKLGRPFSGVTACMDFCAHAHKDIHNMNNGCTVVVTLTKNKDFIKPDEEQLHVLPLYIPDDSDEYGSKENQEMKVRNGEIEVLKKYECEIRTFSEPAATCRNRKSKKEEGQRKRKSTNSQPSSPSVSSTSFQQQYQSRDQSPISYNNSEIQNGQISSTVLDSPNRNPNWRYDNFSSNYENSIGVHSNGNNISNHHLPQFSVFKTSYAYNYSGFNSHYNQDGYLNNYYPHSYNNHPTPNLFSHFASHQLPPYKSNNPFDDCYSNNTLTTPRVVTGETKTKSVDIKYTDNLECFKDPEIGGVAIALSHGSILFECAKHELHATTALRNPDRTKPTRISLVFYQHRNLNKSQHGLDEYNLKQKSKLDESQSDFDSSFDSSILNSSLEKCSGEVLLRTATLPTVSVTTMFPMYPCMVTGPYQEHFASSLSMPNK